jgi:acetyl esterase/lipase
MVSLTQHTVRAHSIILALSKKIEPSWRLSKGKEAHQSIHCRQKLVPFYLTFKRQPPVAMPPAGIENRTIPGGPNGSNISINIVRPQGSNGTLLPVVMYFHGGGWVLGGFDTHERLVRELTNKANVAVVFVDYTLSPEAKYPVPIEEAYAGTRWVAENGKLINVDPSRL